MIIIIIYRIYSRISREILGKIICKSLGGRLIPGARHQTNKQKTVLEHVQNWYNAIYMRLTLD